MVLVCFISSINDMASSMPGTAVENSLSKPANMPAPPPSGPPPPPAPPSAAAASASASAVPSSMAAAASISMQYRLAKPCTSVGLRENFWLKASDRLCAGSVDTISTLRRADASATPSEQDDVVLPTPPLPPTNTHFSERCATTFANEGSDGIVGARRRRRAGAPREAGGESDARQGAETHR
jgi:hypothetical protein